MRFNLVTSELLYEVKYLKNGHPDNIHMSIFIEIH